MGILRQRQTGDDLMPTTGKNPEHSRSGFRTHGLTQETVPNLNQGVRGKKKSVRVSVRNIGSKLARCVLFGNLARAAPHPPLGRASDHNVKRDIQQGKQVGSAGRLRDQSQPDCGRIHAKRSARRTAKLSHRARRLNFTIAGSESCLSRPRNFPHIQSNGRSTPITMTQK